MVRTDGKVSHSINTAIAVFILHVLLAIVGTYPMIFEMDRAVIGGGDTAQNMWNLWWVQWAFAQNNWFPMVTDRLYAPLGVSLAYHPLGLLNGWLGLALQNVLGMNLVCTYNTLVLISFVATGLTTFDLIKALVENNRVAFVASLVFVYAPIRISRVHYGNLEMFSTEFIPLAVLGGILLYRTRKIRYGIGSALSIAATAWLSLYLALGTAILMGMLMGILFIRERTSRRDLLKPIGWLCVLTLGLMMPLIVPMLQNFEAFRDQSNQIPASIANSADFVGFFVPDSLTNPVVKRLSPSIGDWITHVYARFQGNSAEKTVFVGYTTLILVGVAIGISRSTWLGCWLLIAGVFFVLCLGPQLHVAGHPVLNHLPYEWINKLPLVGFGRAPSRLAIFLMLALSVVNGLGLSALEHRDKRWKWFTLLAGVLIFVEFLTIPIRLDRRFSTMSPYYWKLRAVENPDAVVLDIPVDLVGAQGPAGDYMLYQTVHQKRMISVYISRTPRYVLRLFDRPFLKALRARIYNDHAPYEFDVQVLSQARKELNDLHVKYVILHKNALSEKDIQIVRSALFTVLQEPDYEDELIVVWEYDRTRTAR